MRGECWLYPGLGRYFSTKEELAKAGCMERRHLDDCLKGIKEFKQCEKEAISKAVYYKVMHGDLRFIGAYDLTKIEKAVNGGFDEEFRCKQGVEKWLRSLQ